MDAAPGATSPDAADRLPEFFISRAGPDAEIGKAIAQILETAGRPVIIEDRDFQNRSFMERMDSALRSGARTIALLSPEYLVRDHCKAEWQNTIADDPLNRQSRLIVLRIRPCVPVGLLKSLAYCDLVPVLAGLPGSSGMLHDVVLAAIEPGRHKSLTADLSKLFSDARPVLHPKVAPTPNFIGRKEEFTAIAQALSGDARPTVVHGLGGTGKSTLVREYAWRAAGNNGYTGIWWLNAAKAPDPSDDERGPVFNDIEQGLVDLREVLFPGMGKPKERAQAAHETLAFLSAHGADRPWLLVYDNVDDERVLDDWAPPANVRLVMTSRIANWGSNVTAVAVGEWTTAEAVRYLRAESGRADLTDAGAERLATELGLPLALSHAAAYLRKVVNATAESYLNALARHLKEMPKSADPRRAAVFTTLMTNVRQAEASAAGAGAVLSLAAFCAPDDIPEELFKQAAALYPPALQPVVGDAVALEQAIGALGDLSLIEFRPEERDFSVHRLVQVAARDALGAEREAWAAAMIAVIRVTLPTPDFANWRSCERLVPHARAAAEHAGDAVGAPLALLLNNVGYYLGARAAYVEAEPLYLRSVKIRENVLGSNHPEVALALSNLAELYRAQDRYDLVEPLLQRSLAIREKALAPDHPDIGISLNNLAGFYDVHAKYDLAEPLYRRALGIFEQRRGPHHRDVATTLNNLAKLYKIQHKHDLAEPLYRRALAIRERTLDPNHPDIAASLTNLAELYRAQDKPDLGEPLSRRALEIVEKALGPDHPTVATMLSNLAGFHQAQDKYDLAESGYQRALTINEQTLGRDHPAVAIALNNLAELYSAQKKYDLAEPRYQRSLAIREKARGPDHPDVAIALNNLALLYDTQGKYDFAEPLHRRSLTIREKALGPDHPLTGTAAANLARHYEKQGKYDLSEAFYRRALAVREKALGADRHATTVTRYNLAAVLAITHRFDEAEPQARRAQETFERTLGTEHPDTKSAAQLLAAIVTLRGRSG